MQYMYIKGVLCFKYVVLPININGLKISVLMKSTQRILLKSEISCTAVGVRVLSCVTKTITRYLTFLP